MLHHGRGGAMLRAVLLYFLLTRSLPIKKQERRKGIYFELETGTRSWKHTSMCASVHVDTHTQTLTHTYTLTQSFFHSFTVFHFLTFYLCLCLSLFLSLHKGIIQTHSVGDLYSQQFFACRFMGCQIEPLKIES